MAPRDEVAGGTWLGVNAAGLFVAVTNRFGAARDGARRSRGQLVVDALGQPSAEALHGWLAQLDAQAFNPFHLLYADRAYAFVTWTDGERATQAALEPGVHVVTEQSFREEPVARARGLVGGFEALPDKADPAALFPLLQRHEDGDPFAGTCIHAPAFNYGTRSSAVVLLGDGR
ncbi:MAG: NRDE family protein, partial [Deltaproteobacteria bacterium]|nr:NRDE family protein [Deltaproteobacteria bacterium]